MGTAEPVLNNEERDALRVLGYLLLRMGQTRRAARVYAALAAMPTPAGEKDAVALAGAGACLLELGEQDAALRALDEALASGPLPSRCAVLYALRAKALHSVGRGEEAADAAAEFLRRRGDGKA